MLSGSPADSKQPAVVHWLLRQSQLGMTGPRSLPNCLSKAQSSLLWAYFSWKAAITKVPLQSCWASTVHGSHTTSPRDSQCCDHRPQHSPVATAPSEADQGALVLQGQIGTPEKDRGPHCPFPVPFRIPGQFLAQQWMQMWVAALFFRKMRINSS